MTQQSTPATTRRGVLKGGALGLGSVAGALTLGGAGAHVAEAQPLGAALPSLALGGATTYYLEIDGITGESTDEVHKGWIDVLSYSWGATGAATGGTGSGGSSAGRSSMQNLSFMTSLSTASPELFLATMQGRRIASAVLEGTSGADTRIRFVQLIMADVIVASYQTSASGGESRPTESASLFFGKVTYTYWPQKSDGTLDTPVTATWDARTAR